MLEPQRPLEDHIFEYSSSIPTMTSLSDIPNETLSEILSFVANTPDRLPEPLPIGWEWKPICSLSTTCRRFYLLLRPILFGKLDMNLTPYIHPFEPGHSLVPGDSPEKTDRRNHHAPAKFSNFLRSLKENKHLVPMVHHLTVSWEANKDGVFEKANILVRSLPHLRTLSIRGRGSDNPCFQPLFLDLNPMKKLESLNINEPNLAIRDILRYLSCGSLHHMTLYYAPRQGSASSSTGTRNSPLLTLDTGHSRHISPDLLLTILTVCPRLQTLRCAVPGRNAGDGLYRPPSRRNPTPILPFSAEEISKPLSKVKESLRVLEFKENPTKWANVGGCGMDLSMMKVLTSIVCPATCFFVTGAPYIARRNILKLLPTSLEELTLRFEYNHGLICWYERDMIQEDSEYSDDYLWLLELANHKEEYTPHLRALTLRDFETRKIPCIRWNPPKIITQSFIEAWITFSACVNRKPDS